MNIKLSICIPTFNRADFLHDTLNNIIPKLSPLAEIVIMDGASTDNTEEIVRHWQRLSGSIKYFRGDTNGGVDADLAECVERAVGEYCWLMSSDDYLANSALERVLNEIITSDLCVLLGCRVDCTKDMVPLMYQRWIETNSDCSIYHLSQPSAFLNYFNSIRSIGALFSYIPCVIIHRQAWLEVSGAEAYFGTNYAHVFRILEMLKSGCAYKYVSYPLVHCRMDNDSFSSQGLVKRYLIDFRGYSLIAAGLFRDQPDLYKAMLGVMTREHRWPRLLKIRHNCRDATEWNTISEYLKEFGYPNSLILICGLIGRIKPLIRFSQWLYQRSRIIFMRYRDTEVA